MSWKKSLLVFDDKYGKINSHWPYCTSMINIEDHIYYDDSSFEKQLIHLLCDKEYDAFVFSGRNAPDAARLLDSVLKENKQICPHNKGLRKIYKLHNTNLSEFASDTSWNKEALQRLGNDWVRAAIKYPFDVLLIQTYGDCDIFNHALKSNCAFWVPYCYNDRLFYPRENINKDIDIGAYFKLERHDHRFALINHLETIAEKNGYTFEFSDEYWGDEYAQKLCGAKIAIHLSYCGDIPWRLYECAASKTCLLTDPLSFQVNRLFTPGKDYYEYKRDFSDLESKIKELLDEELRTRIVNHAYNTVQQYTWEKISSSLIYPHL